MIDAEGSPQRQPRLRFPDKNQQLERREGQVRAHQEEKLQVSFPAEKLLGVMNDAVTASITANLAKSDYDREAHDPELQQKLNTLMLLRLEADEKSAVLNYLRGQNNPSLMPTIRTMDRECTDLFGQSDALCKEVVKKMLEKGISIVRSENGVVNSVVSKDGHTRFRFYNEVSSAVVVEP